MGPWIPVISVGAGPNFVGGDKGRAEILLKQLRLRFRRVPKAVERRVRAASVEDLDRWAGRVLCADSLDDVLG